MSINFERLVIMNDIHNIIGDLSIVLDELTQQDAVKISDISKQIEQAVHDGNYIVSTFRDRRDGLI